MGEIPDWSHRTELTSEPINASVAREFVRIHLIGHGLLPRVADICLVVSELAANVIVHAHTSFVLTVSATNGSIRVAVAGASEPGSITDSCEVSSCPTRVISALICCSSPSATRQRWVQPLP